MKFQIFKNDKTSDKFELQGAYLFGTDGIAVRRSQIKFKNGVIECKKSNLETAGLALMWPIEDFGNILLPTTCLPESDSPYILNLEIARAKLMQIINKREDWALFNNCDDIKELSCQAQDLFIKAVQNISEPAVAASYADDSLKKAIVFSEKLAAKQSELLFNARCRGHSFGRGRRVWKDLRFRRDNGSNKSTAKA